jgi:hypothetical protein
LVNDPHETVTRQSRFAKNERDEAFLDALNNFLASATLPFGGDTACNPSTLPILYIVGAPRSGTTLLSQLVSRYLPVGYIDNLTARFWRRPSVGIRLSEALLGENRRNLITLESTHGVTNGIAEPHEFGYFWGHWFRLAQAATHHLDETLLAKTDAKGLRHALEDEILREFRAPVVFKNIICGFHAKFLTKLHPRSLFIYVERDLKDTCASILKCRLERYGTYEAWWSLRPSTFPSFSIDPVEQVVRQVIDSRREMYEEICTLRNSPIRVEYTKLCANPSDALESIADRVSRIGDFSTPILGRPSALRARKASRLSRDFERKLDQEISAIEEPAIK